MKHWTQIREWRLGQRKALLTARRSMAAPEVKSANAKIERNVGALLHGIGGLSVGFYWPIQGEPDVLPVMREFVKQGGHAALPVAVDFHRPLEFRRWRPGDPMHPDACGVPAPKWRELLLPGLLLVPVLGFDKSFHRLGNGTGFFDRTMASLTRKPVAMGVGYQLAALSTIYPRTHDVALDGVTTEAGTRWRSMRPDDVGLTTGNSTPASSPCYAAEFCAGMERAL